MAEEENTRDEYRKSHGFLESWISENVRSMAHPQSDAAAKQLARRCVIAAEQQGISKADLEKACGQGLIACMCDAQAAVADASISKLMDEN